MPASSPQLTCNELHQLYKDLILLKKQITILFQEDIPKKDFTPTKQLKKQIEEKIVFLKKQLPVSIYKAKELLTTKEEKEQGIIHVYGPEEIERAFGIKIGEEDIPLIPFTRKELKRAGELKEKLILRIPDCTLEVLQELMTLRADTEAMKNTGGLSYISDSIKDLYFTQDKTKLEWALVSAKPLDNSYNKTAPVQLKLFIDHLEQVIYKDQPLPKKYQEGVTRFKKQYPEIIARLTGITLQEFKNKTDQEADNLIYDKINNDTERQELINWLENQPIAKQLTYTPVTWFYDFCLRYQNATTPEQKQPLQEQYQNYTRLLRRSSPMGLVYCGLLDSGGVLLGGWDPGRRDGDIGVSLSCN